MCLHSRIRSILLPVLALVSGFSNAATLTFDDIPGATINSAGAIGNYSGFDFTTNLNTNLDWVDTVNKAWESDGLHYGSISPYFTMVNDNFGMGIITEESGNDFTFDGLYARTWGDDGDRTQHIVGLKDSAVVWDSEITLTSTWTYYSGVSGNIDELQLDLGDYFIVDNLEMTAVPLPATLYLFAAGLLGLSGVLRVKKSA